MSQRDYSWQLLPLEPVRGFVSAINPVVKPEALDPEATEVRFTTLPFYPDQRFCLIIDHSRGEPNRRFALAGPKEIVLFNKTNEPIYRANQRNGVLINPSTAVAYALFFFDHVYGKHGRFLIMESAMDVAWLPDADPATVARVAAAIAPPRVEDIDADGRYLIVAKLIFKNALFRATIRVALDGALELTDEQPEIEDLPVAIDPPSVDLPMNMQSEGQLYAISGDGGPLAMTGCGASAWRPIETAPHDGTRILVLSVDRTEHAVSWNPRGTSWADANGTACETGQGSLQVIGHWAAAQGWFQPNEVTHWRPHDPAGEGVKSPPMDSSNGTGGE